MLEPRDWFPRNGVGLGSVQGWAGAVACMDGRQPSEAGRQRGTWRRGLRRAGVIVRRRLLRGQRIDAAHAEHAAAPAPIFAPMPCSSMWGPLAVVLAVLPGLYALAHWDLVPPGPWWGLRGLAVLEGHLVDQSNLSGIGQGVEARAYRRVAMQPPLYAWLEAVTLALSGNRAPVATVVPSYLAGMLLVLLVYQHGRIWGGAALGLIAALLTGFNRELLLQMQQTTPTTLALALSLGALGAYGRALRATTGRRRASWAAVAGLSLGGSLLSASGFGLIVPAVMVLHRAMLPTDKSPPSLPTQYARKRWARQVRRERATAALLVCLAATCALLVAAPWYLVMAVRHGAAFWTALMTPQPGAAAVNRNSLDSVLFLAPATVTLGIYGAARAAGRLLRAKPGDLHPQTVGSALWLAWLIFALVLPVLFPPGLATGSSLFLLVPLNLFAGQTILALSERRAPARALVLLVPCTLAVIAWWSIPELRLLPAYAVGVGGKPRLATEWMRIGLTLVLLLAACMIGLDRWARRSDERQRRLIVVYLGSLLVLTVFLGFREIHFRHRETVDLLALRDAVLRRHAQNPLTVIGVLGPEVDLSESGPQQTTAARGFPGGRLRFILRSALPHLPQIDLPRAQDLLALPEGERLVVLAGLDTHLTYHIQARLRLESLHPGHHGLLDAYATPIDPPAATARSR